MITDIEEETEDLDWFSVDENGEIAHFASGGRGFLPLSVKRSRSNLDRLNSFFGKLLDVNGVVVESTSLPLHLQFDSAGQKSTYLEYFLRMGAKGLYSFDCVIGPKRPSDYFLVVTPSCPLKVDDLPGDIKQILNMTHYSGRFCSVVVIKMNEVV